MTVVVEMDMSNAGGTQSQLVPLIIDPQVPKDPPSFD